MPIFKTNVSKEDFKRAYTSCAKEAWVMHSKENFEKAYKLLKDKKYHFNIDIDVNDEDSFGGDASAINVMEAFEQALSGDKEALEDWDNLWKDPQNANLETYSGDSIEDGNAVGAAARTLFDHKLKLDNSGMLKENYEGWNFKDAFKRTREVVEQNKKEFKYKYLYEPAFSFDGDHLKIRCDILEFLNETDVVIYEVKATSKVKKDHFFDLAYQRYVLEQNGFNVKDMYIVHMAPDYVMGIDHPFDLKKEANRLEETFPDMSYEEVVQYVKENNLLEPFEAPEVDDNDVDLNRLFDIDPLTYGTAQDRLTLMEVYDGLAKSHDIGLLIKQLADQLSIKPDDDKALENLFNKELCPDLLDYDKKSNSWFYKERYCFHVLPYYDDTKENIFNFTGLHKDIKAELFRKTGKMYLEDISSLSKDFPLNTSGKESKSYFNHAHERHFEVFEEWQKQGKVTSEMIIDTNNLKEIRSILKEYEDAKNIYMFDFETVKFAIPKFLYSKSYQQIPFQYSIHILYDDKYDYNNADKTMVHYEFIGNQRKDPRPHFMTKFINEMLMTDGEGVYVAYNKSFERTVLKYLATEFPKYRVPLMYIAVHTIDLMDFFKGSKKVGREDFLIYHPDFHGSYSIKKTQPALDEHFNYHDLTINKGDKAAQVWRMYCENRLDDAKWKTVKPQMLKYCERDTLAMVVILQQVEKHLKEVDKDILNRKGDSNE